MAYLRRLVVSNAVERVLLGKVLVLVLVDLHTTSAILLGNR